MLMFSKAISISSNATGKPNVHFEKYRFLIVQIDLDIVEIPLENHDFVFFIIDETHIYT